MYVLVELTVMFFSVSNPDEFYLVPVSGPLLIKNDAKIIDRIAKVLYNNIKSFSIFFGIKNGKY